MRLDDLKFTDTLDDSILVQSEYVSDTPEKVTSTRNRGKILFDHCGTHHPMFWTNSPGVFGMSVLSIEDLEAIIKKMKELV